VELLMTTAMRNKNPTKIKLSGNLGYYIKNNFIMYTDHVLSLG
jgi:hypothetical protein